jgi:hypothetical protein
MQRQFLRVVRTSLGARWSGLAIAALGAVVALVGCGSGERQLEGGASGVATVVPNDPSGGRSDPLPPSSEVMSPDEVVVPSFDPNEGEGTPILVTDPLTQPLGIDGMEVADLTKSPFKAQFVTSLKQSASLFAFSDYSLVGLVYRDTEFGSLIVKEGINPQRADFDAIVREVDDPSTPERFGVDPSNGHTYLGVDTPYGTALVESVNGYVSVHFNLIDNIFVEVTGVDKLFTMKLAAGLASSANFSPSP